MACANKNNNGKLDVESYRTRVKENVVVGMLEFCQDEDCDFSKRDVKKCERLLLNYIEQLSRLADPTDEAIMEQVKEVVLALNRLNEKTDYSLIETLEREEIWQIIQDSAVECGLTSPAGDITEAWREW